MEFEKEEIEGILKKYGKKLGEELGEEPQAEEAEQESSADYLTFKSENLPKHLSRYEKGCNWAENLVKIAPPKKQREQLIDAIEVCHLNTTPEGVMGFAIIFPFFYMLLGIALSFLPLVWGDPSNTFFMFFFIFSGVIAMIPLTRYPLLIATKWRLKASNQMVLSIFYVVTYMRHTSNLENAIDFAAERLAPPLSLDFKKILWDVETERFESVKESLDHYLESWRKWNMEFIEAMHLIESSLYEGDEGRRQSMLDKSLNVILEETYEKMLHYAHNLKTPITMLHMIGIILPILGLVILPLAVSFMEGIKWWHLAMLYNIAIPASVYYYGMTVLSNRPTGYGDTDISELNPDLGKEKKAKILGLRIPPLYVALIVGVTLLSIGLSPLMMHAINPNFDVPLGDAFLLLDFHESKPNSETGETTIIGPYGLGSAVLSLFIPLAFGIGAGLYYSFQSKNVIKVREETKKLEDEFASALFQLGNRLGDGIPAEMAFGRVAESMQGTRSGSFFNIVDQNIKRIGMNVAQAIFNKQNGALLFFPSAIIESSMKVLTQSMKKGPMIAAQALTNVSRYIKEIHSVNERLKDLMADIVSSMRSQMAFLAPTISGIVIGITSMITTIIGALSGQLTTLGEDAGSGAATAGLSEMFGDGVPTFYFQIVVGLYVVQIVYILAIMTNGIENGSDKLSEKYILGKALIRSTLLYCFIALAVMLLFNMIAGSVLQTDIGGL